MNTLRIRNWERWQTYRRDRGQPPWIKVHREVMRNPDWVALTDAQRGQLVAIWLLAADHDGAIPASPKLIQKLCYLDTEPDLQLFMDHGFIEPDANVTPARRQHDAPETETEAEAETEKDPRAKKPRARADKPALPDPPAWLPSEAWERWQTHRQEIRKPLKPTQAAAQFDKLAGYRSDGHDPVTVIDHSIAGGWQGLFPPDKPRGTNGGRYETAHDRIQRACADPFDDDDGRTISGHAEAVEADGGDFWGRQVGTSLRRGSQ